MSFLDDSMVTAGIVLIPLSISGVWMIDCPSRNVNSLLRLLFDVMKTLTSGSIMGPRRRSGALHRSFPYITTVNDKGEIVGQKPAQ